MRMLSLLLFTTTIAYVINSCVSTSQSSVSQTQQQSQVISSSGDSLNHTGIIGVWEKQYQTINGTLDGSVCCEQLTFMIDPQPMDLIGDVVYIKDGDTLTGDFEVVQHTDSLFLDFYISTSTFGYALNDTVLTLNSTFNGNSIEETWVKNP